MEHTPEDEAPEELSDSDKQALLLRYAEEIKQRSNIPFYTPPRSWNTPAVRWILATTSLLALCGLEAWLLVQPVPSRAPQPTAAVFDIERNDPCARRQIAIVQAVASYKSHYGRPPDELDLLGPPYLNEAVVDPVSGRPYEYRHEGDAIVIACPNPSRHPFVGVADESRAGH